MSVLATKLTPVATKFQIVVAASAIAIAAAVPTVVANAEPAFPSPMAPISQILGEPILGPMNIAEQPCLIPNAAGCGQGTAFDSFAALVVAVVGLFLLPITIFVGLVSTIFGRVGPYGTARV